MLCASSAAEPRTGESEEVARHRTRRNFRIGARLKLLLRSLGAKVQDGPRQLVGVRPRVEAQSSAAFPPRRFVQTPIAHAIILASIPTSIIGFLFSVLASRQNIAAPQFSWSHARWLLQHIRLPHTFVTALSEHSAPSQIAQNLTSTSLDLHRYHSRTSASDLLRPHPATLV